MVNLSLELDEPQMTDSFSEYVTLLDDIEQIPATAREAPNLPAEQRAVVMARVVALVRDRVLPQSKREGAGLDALLDDGRGSFDSAASAGVTGHDAILAPIDELASANPQDGARVQELLYRVHAAVAGRFSEAEVMLAAVGDEDEPARGAARPRPGRVGGGGDMRPSPWFG